MLMRKVLLILIFLLSFAIISHSDPPEGYKYREYNFSVRDCHGQYLPGATATISDTTWVDMGASTLTSGSNGGIIIRFLVPSDPEVSEPSFNGIQVTISANGYQDFVQILTSCLNYSMELQYSL